MCYNAPYQCHVMVPALLWWISAPRSYAASRLQRRTGGSRPHIRVLAPRWWTPAPPSYARFSILTYFHAVFGFNAALADSYDPFLRSLAAAAPHGWTPAFHAHATSCEQRSCTRDTSKQVLRRSLAALHEDKERRLSPLNEPVDSLNLAMIFPYDLRYGLP